MFSQPAAVTALLDAGGDPARTNDTGQTPLEMAVSEGRPAGVIAALEAGAEPDLAAQEAGHLGVTARRPQNPGPFPDVADLPVILGLSPRTQHRIRPRATSRHH